MRNLMNVFLAAMVVAGSLAILGGVIRPRAEGQAYPTGQLSTKEISGAGDGGVEEEEIQWVGMKGSLRVPREAKFQRQVLKVPESYGNLVSVTGETLWFQDKNGVLRNVIWGFRLVKIVREPSR